jgi:hypothetical protein
MVLEKLKSMHLVLNMFIFTRTLVTYAITIFKPRCCVYSDVIPLIPLIPLRGWKNLPQLAYMLFKNQPGLPADRPALCLHWSAYRRPSNLPHLP